MNANVAMLGSVNSGAFERRFEQPERQKSAKRYDDAPHTSPLVLHGCPICRRWRLRVNYTRVAPIVAMLGRMKAVWRRARDYVKYDLREIIAPSSIPDPPETEKIPKLTWQEYREVRSKVAAVLLWDSGQSRRVLNGMLTTTNTSLRFVPSLLRYFRRVEVGYIMTGSARRLAGLLGLLAHKTPGKKFQGGCQSAG